MKTLKKQPNLMPVLPPAFEGPEQPDFNKPLEDKGLGVWVAPFVMAVINTKNVHRANMLLGHPYSTDFQYDEMLIVGLGDKGKAMTEQIASMNPIGRGDGPKPGEKASKEERETGFYDLLFVAEADDGKRLKVAVTGDKDPGYGPTSKIISEAAIFLAEGHGKKSGGIYTAGAAFGRRLSRPLSRAPG